MAVTQDLLIFPFNGNGLEALDCLDDTYRFVGFVDDTPEKIGTSPYGHRVFTRDAFEQFPNALVLAVPGSPVSYQNRRSVIEGLGLQNDRFAKVIHPKASISPLAKVGSNVLVMAGVVITSNAVIGSNTCILPNTVIHHDVTIGDWSLIGANVTIAGNTYVEENCYIGSGSSVINNIKIGSKALIGIGSNIIKDVSTATTVVGNPGRQLVKN